MGIFGKGKKSESEDALIDQLTEEGDQKEVKKKNTSLGKTEARIEKLDSEMSTLRELLDTQRERFEREGEEIGELRSMLADREKQIRELESKALKASELVAEVQPEKLMSEQKKTEARIDAIKAKLENSEVISGNIIDELKKIKNSMSTFRGTEDILKLNKEVRDELTDIKKVEASVQKHADRVEARYSNFESNFQEFEKMKEAIADNNDFVKALRTDVEKNKADMLGIPKKEELYHMKKDIQNTLEIIRKERDVYETRNESIENVVETTSKKSKIVEENMNTLSNTLNDVSKSLIDVAARSNDLFKAVETMGHSYKKLSNLEVNISGNAHKIDALTGVVETIAKRG